MKKILLLFVVLLNVFIVSAQTTEEIIQKKSAGVRYPRTR